ncbi:MAG: HK97 family phage prohead protease [Phycisphaerae bacterium]|nr:HK97 family phage prohead protease [Phycisphaerae bacterium]
MARLDWIDEVAVDLQAERDFGASSELQGLYGTVTAYQRAAREDARKAALQRNSAARFNGFTGDVTDQAAVERFLANVELVPESRVELRAATNAITLQAGDAEVKGKQFRGIAYSGAPVRYGSRNVIIDLAGLEVPTRTIAVLRDHDPGQIVGQATRFDKTAGRLNIEGTITLETPAGREVSAVGLDGFNWNMSIGFAIAEVRELSEGATATINGRTIQGPALIFSKTKLLEVSFVPVGADQQTTAEVFTRGEMATV